MKAPTEGKAALEAAVDGMVSAEEWSSFWSREDAGRLFLAGLRAYLDALSGWRMVPEDPDEAMGLAGGCVLSGDDAPYAHEISNAGCVWEVMLAKAPPAPGLKESDHG